MELLLSQQANEYIIEKSNLSNGKLVIIIYQYAKHGCSGSYLDLYVELDKEINSFNKESYEKLMSVNINQDDYIDVYLETRIKDLFNEAPNILIDAKEHEKLGDKYIELVLKKI